MYPSRSVKEEARGLLNGGKYERLESDEIDLGDDGLWSIGFCAMRSLACDLLMFCSAEISAILRCSSALICNFFSLSGFVRLAPLKGVSYVFSSSATYIAADDVDVLLVVLADVLKLDTGRSNGVSGRSGLSNLGNTLCAALHIVALRSANLACFSASAFFATIFFSCARVAFSASVGIMNADALRSIMRRNP